MNSNKQKTMTNNKQSSISQLIAEIQRRVAIIQSEPQTTARELMIDNLSVDLEQYEAMHKEETKSTFYEGAFRESCESGQRYKYVGEEDAEKFYNETYGGK